MPAPLRPISATLSPGARRSVTPRRIAGPSRSSCHARSISSAATGRPLRRAPRLRLRLRASFAGRRPSLSGSIPFARSAARRLSDANRRGSESGAARTASRRESAAPARLAPAHARNAWGSPSQATPPPCSAITRSAAARQRSRRCSASTIVVSHSWLSRRRRLISSSPATGSSCEVGSSSSTSRGLPGECRAERDTLLLATRELVRGAIQQRVDAEREGHLLHAPRDGPGAVAAALQRERELGAHRAHHELRLGVLEQHAGYAPQPGAGRALACPDPPASPGRRSARRGSGARARRPPSAASTFHAPRGPRAGRTRPARSPS